MEFILHAILSVHKHRSGVDPTRLIALACGVLDLDSQSSFRISLNSSAVLSETYIECARIVSERIGVVCRKDTK